MTNSNKLELNTKPMKTGAVVGMTYEIIAKYLNLTDGYKIVSAWVDPARDLFYVRIDGPGLPETPEGQEYVHVSPAFDTWGNLVNVFKDPPKSKGSMIDDLNVCHGMGAD